MNTNSSRTAGFEIIDFVQNLITYTRHLVKDPQEAGAIVRKVLRENPRKGFGRIPKPDACHIINVVSENFLRTSAESGKTSPSAISLNLLDEDQEALLWDLFNVTPDDIVKSSRCKERSSTTLLQSFSAAPAGEVIH